MHRAGLTLLTFGTVAVAAAYMLALFATWRTPAPWLLASGTTAVLAGLAAIGAARHGRRTPVLTAAIAVAFVSVAAGLLVPLGMSAPGPADALWLGLPRPTAIVLLCVHALPLVLLPVAYAVAFEREVLSEDDLERFRSPR